MDKDTSSGLSLNEEKTLLKRLTDDLNIQTELIAPPIPSAKKVCGYIIKKINENHPVQVSVKFSLFENHAIVITGYNQTGFFINDPSGAFFSKIPLSYNYNNLINRHVPYDEFIKSILMFDHTLIVNSYGNDFRNSVSLNFRPGYITIHDKSSRTIGLLNLGGKYKISINGSLKPQGYAFIDQNTRLERSFDGEHVIKIYPRISNSTSSVLAAHLHLKIDNKDVNDSPQRIEPIKANYSNYLPFDILNESTVMKAPLKYLSTGIHTVTVELRSINSQYLYDFWNFPILIENEYNGQAPNKPTLPFPNNGDAGVSTSLTLSWSCSDPDIGDQLTYDVYFGTSQPAMSKVASNLTNPSLILNGLTRGTIYFWSVFAKDNHGNSTEGDIWRFTTIGYLPVADFIANQRTIIVGQSVQFTDQSTNSPTSWRWNFGDGSTSTSRNPSHTYTAAGTYTVSLTATNSAGSNTETKTGYIVVNPVVIVPVAAFTAAPRLITAGQTVQFTDQSTNNPTSWNWNFGDGNTSTSRSPSYTYSAAGTYTVSLTATNSAGSNTETKIGYIVVNPDSYGIIFNPNLTYGSVSDIDGNNYRTIQIGTQTWMAENLKTTRYNDGTNIPHVTDNIVWGTLKTPGYCWYNNNAEAYKNVYGALYNWYTVNTGKLCPEGWHVPTNLEWTILIDHIGGEATAADMLKEAGFEHWVMNSSVNPTNLTGFTALPGGIRWLNDSWRFSNMYHNAYWWASNEYSASLSWQLFMSAYQSNVNLGWGVKECGHSVRCIKD